MGKPVSEKGAEQTRLVVAAFKQQLELEAAKNNKQIQKVEIQK